MEQKTNNTNNKLKKVEPDNCQHEWQSYKKTIIPDNPKFKGTAYFKVRACIKCKKIEYIDLVEENNE